jgi:FkbM family methyltransferase
MESIPLIDRLTLLLTRRPWYRGRRTIARFASMLTPKVVLHTFDVDGISWYMSFDKRDLLQFDYYYFGTYSSAASLDVAYVLRNILRDGFIFLDVGANVGLLSLYASKLIPNGKVYAIEPIPKTFEKLELNIKLNRLRNITALRNAITNRSGRSQMEYYPANSGLSHLKADCVSSLPTVWVECITLDELLDRIGIVPHVIKLDCEGAEPLILEGAQSSLKHKELRYMIMEVNNNLLEGNFSNGRELISMLREYGFTVRHIKTDGTLSDEFPFHLSYFNILAWKGCSL